MNPRRGRRTHQMHPRTDPPRPRLDPRLYQIACLRGLLVYGIAGLHFEVQPLGAAVILAAALLTQYACSRAWRLTVFEPKSALISGLSLCLLLRTNHLGLALLLFTFFMISDPRTTPSSRAGRILFAALVAAGAAFVQFRLFRTNGLLWSLALASPLVPLIDRLLPGERHEWRRTSSSRSTQSTGGEYETIADPGGARARPRAVVAAGP